MSKGHAWEGDPERATAYRAALQAVPMRWALARGRGGPRCNGRAVTRAMEQQSALARRVSINGEEKEPTGKIGFRRWCAIAASAPRRAANRHPSVRCQPATWNARGHVLPSPSEWRT